MPGSFNIISTSFSIFKRAKLIIIFICELVTTAFYTFDVHFAVILAHATKNFPPTPPNQKTPWVWLKCKKIKNFTQLIKRVEHCRFIFHLMKEENSRFWVSCQSENPQSFQRNFILKECMKAEKISQLQNFHMKLSVILWLCASLAGLHDRWKFQFNIFKGYDGRTGVSTIWYQAKQMMSKICCGQFETCLQSAKIHYAQSYLILAYMHNIKDKNFAPRIKS